MWPLATIAGTGLASIRPVAALFCVATIGYAVLTGKYFLITAVIPDLVLALLLGLAFLLAAA